MNDERDQSIKAFCLEAGFSLFGSADITGIRNEFLLSDAIRSRFPRAIALAKRLSDSVLEDIQDLPTALYFHHYRQMNNFLDRAALQVADHIQDMGFEALAIAASQIIDWENQRAHVSHKAVAVKAGLGWIGRNNLLVTPQFGSRVRLVTVLTDLPLEPGIPIAFGCGDCLKCMVPCPAGAIGRDPGDFDHHRCYDQLNDFRRRHIVSQHICGVCVKACRGPVQCRR